MSARAIRSLAAAALALLSSRVAADAVDGMVGGGFATSSNSSSAGEASRTRSWDFAGNLSLAGVVVSPSFLTYAGAVGYQTLHSSYFDSSSASNNLTYQLSAAALTAHPFSMNAAFMQSWNRFNSDGGSSTTGDSRGTGMGVAAGLGFPDLPAVDVHADRREVVNHSFGVESQTQAASVGAGVHQQIGGLGYSLSYGTSWNQGTFAETNYRLHDFMASVTAALSRDVEARFTDHYYLRAPTLDAPTNPRYDDQTLGAGVNWPMSPKLNSRIDYAYQHSLVTAPTMPSEEVVGHSASYALDYRRSADLSLSAAASGRVGVARSGPTEERVLGQSVSGGAQWGHEYARFRLQLQGTLGINAAEQEAGGSAYGYTAQGGSSLATGILGWLCSLGYNATYGSAIGGLAGYSFGHAVSATADGAPWRRGSVRLQLSAGSSRSESPLFGTGLSRSVAINATGTWRALSSFLVLGASDGLADPLRHTGFADGLFIPSRFNTSSRYATLSAGAPFLGVFTLNGAVNYLETTSPGRPKQWEEGVGGSLTYNLGALSIAADDRISRGGYGGFWRVANQFMIRASRSFEGPRF